MTTDEILEEIISTLEEACIGRPMTDVGIKEQALQLAREVAIERGFQPPNRVVEGRDTELVLVWDI